MMKKAILIFIMVVGLVGLCPAGSIGGLRVSAEVKFDESNVTDGGMALGDHFKIIRFHGKAEHPDYDLNLELGYGFNPDMVNGEYSYQDMAYYLGIKMYNMDMVRGKIILGGYNKAVYEDRLDTSTGNYQRINRARSAGILMGFGLEAFINEKITIKGDYYSSFPYIRYTSTVEKYSFDIVLNLEGGGFLGLGYIVDKFYDLTEITRVKGVHIGLGRSF